MSKHWRRCACSSAAAREVDYMGLELSRDRLYDERRGETLT
jgi:hypothetical protein